LHGLRVTTRWEYLNNHVMIGESDLCVEGCSRIEGLQGHECSFVRS